MFLKVYTTLTRTTYGRLKVVGNNFESLVQVETKIDFVDLCVKSKEKRQHFDENSCLGFFKVYISRNRRENKKDQ